MHRLMLESSIFKALLPVFCGLCLVLGVNSNEAEARKGGNRASASSAKSNSTRAAPPPSRRMGEKAPTTGTYKPRCRSPRGIGCRSFGGHD